MPSAQGVINWSADGGNVAALVHEDMLPLTDASMDRILAIHCLETTANVRDLLRELWRVLAPGGRLIIAVPNRRGIWARVERTPFGYGRPSRAGRSPACCARRSSARSPGRGAVRAALPRAGCSSAPAAAGTGSAGCSGRPFPAS